MFDEHLLCNLIPLPTLFWGKVFNHYLDLLPIASVPELLNTADIAYLLTADTLSGCGIAYFNTVTMPYGLGTHSCARGGYSFGHELGHILGLVHNAEAYEGNSNPAFPFGLGYLIQPPGPSKFTGYRTILAYVTYVKKKFVAAC